MNAARLSAHSVFSLLAGTCLTATLFVGCGGDNATTDPADSPAATTDPAGAPLATTSRPSGTTVEASTLAVPPGGPKAITEFPIPRGAKIVDLGPAIGGNWQFGISSPNVATTLNFYKNTLVAEGYTLKEKASITVGVNTVEYDLAFFGKLYVVVDENALAGGTAVTVAERPIEGLEP